MSNVQERAKPHTALKVAFVAALAYGVIAGTPLRASLTDTQGQVYYVSAQTGSLGNDGTDPTHPFLTISQCSAILQPGDTCIVGAGTYRETVTPAQSGTVEQPITYTAAAGVTATVSGADPVTRWTRVGATNVYTAPVSVPISGTADTGFLANQVFVDGAMMPEARWPNVTSFDPLTGINRASATDATTTTITDTTLPAGNYTGALLHYWGNKGWIARTAPVTASATHLLTITAPAAGCPNICAAAGTLYYLSGLPALLDAPGEWVYTGTVATPAGGSGTVALWPPGSDSPLSHTVEMKERTWAFDLSGARHITIAGLTLFAAGITTTQSSSYDTIENITATYVSHFQTIPEPEGGVPYGGHKDDTGIVLSGTHHLLTDSRIAYSAGNGVSLTGSDSVISNTLVHDADYSGSYDAPIRITAMTGPLTVTHSTIYGAGRDGINNARTGLGAWGAAGRLSYLDIYDVGLLNQDLGGIYVAANLDGAGTRLDHIWAHDLRVTTNGLTTIGAGIYIDNGSGNFALDHIVAWNNQAFGVFLNNTSAPNFGGTTAAQLTLPGGQTRDFEMDATGGLTTTLQSSILSTAPISPTGSVGNTSYVGVPSYTDAAHHDYRLAAAVSGFVNVGAYPYEVPSDWSPGCQVAVSALCQDPDVPTRLPHQGGGD